MMIRLILEAVTCILSKGVDTFMDKFEVAIDVVNCMFFGCKVMIGDKNANLVCPTMMVRNAIKYISLDQRSRDIWDDPNMIQAHKYQNIPQIDISYYRNDYIVDGKQRMPIEVYGDEVVVTYVYSATKEVHHEVFRTADPLWFKLKEMTRLDQTVEAVQKLNLVDIDIQEQMLIFAEDDLSDLIADGVPEYNVTIADIYNKFKTHPDALYVPYRRGWSRVLNIAKYDKKPTDREYAIICDGKESAHILDSSTVSIWDGKSWRIENHGVEAEDMKTYLMKDLKDVHSLIRRLEGTHEYIKDTTIVPIPFSNKDYYVIYTIKGFNCDGFEFNMP